MHDFIDFTVNTSAFPLKNMAKLTKKYHYIPIIDAGIAINPNTTAYKEGMKR